MPQTVMAPRDKTLTVAGLTLFVQWQSSRTKLIYSNLCLTTFWPHPRFGNIQLHRLLKKFKNFQEFISNQGYFKSILFHARSFWNHVNPVTERQNNITCTWHMFNYINQLTKERENTCKSSKSTSYTLFHKKIYLSLL